MISTYDFGGHHLTANNLQTAICDLDIDQNEECSLCLFGPAPLSLLMWLLLPGKTTAAEVRGSRCPIGCKRRQQSEQRLVCESQALSPRSFLSLPASSLLSAQAPTWSLVGKHMTGLYDCESVITVLDI